MPKVRKTSDGWLIECPGCGNMHKFDERWTFNNDLDKPSFQPSLLVNGNMQFLSDCTHELADQTVELEDF